MERLTGHRPDELLGQHFGVLVHESSREVAELDWSAGMAAESQELRGRVNLRGPDGEPVPAEFIAVARLDEDGSFAGANGSVRDMRERDRLERELRESETRFRQLVQTTPDVIYRCDAEGRFLFMAEGSEALFGWKPSEVAGMTFADLTAEESLPLAIMNFESQREERDVVRRYRYMLKHHDGTVFPAAISSVSVWEDDKFAGVQGTVRGQSEQERLERELRESEERYRFLVENSPDVVFATDADGRFTFISEAIEAMTGYSPSEAVDQHFSMLVQPGFDADRGGPVGEAGRRPRHPAGRRADAHRQGRPAHPGRGPHDRHRRARTARSPGSTAPPATSASASDSSASCADPRSATGTWCRPRRTSSGSRTPTAS